MGKWGVTGYAVGCTSAFSKPSAVACGGQPFSDTEEYSKALESKPDHVVIMFGTSDAARGPAANFDRQGFVSGYLRLVQAFQRLGSDVNVFVMSPPPLYQAGDRDPQVVDDVYPEL